MSLIRDYILSKNAKAHFPLHYVLVAGLAGGLPDIDIFLSLILNLAGTSDWWIHKTFTHSFFFPLLFVILFLVFSHSKLSTVLCPLRNHRLKLNLLFLMIAFGTFTHTVLDSLAGEQAYWFYPFSLHDFGINLFSYAPLAGGITAALLDGILLVFWIAYLEFKHNISDFI